MKENITANDVRLFQILMSEKYIIFAPTNSQSTHIFFMDTCDENYTLRKSKVKMPEAFGKKCMHQM